MPGWILVKSQDCLTRFVGISCMVQCAPCGMRELIEKVEDINVLDLLLGSVPFDILFCFGVLCADLCLTT